MKTRKKNRLDAFHYNDWYFFITVNVQNHEKVFGEVVDDKMILKNINHKIFDPSYEKIIFSNDGLRKIAVFFLFRVQSRKGAKTPISNPTPFFSWRDNKTLI